MLSFEIFRRLRLLRTNRVFQHVAGVAAEGLELFEFIEVKRREANL